VIAWLDLVDDRLIVCRSLGDDEYREEYLVVEERRGQVLRLGEWINAAHIPGLEPPLRVSQVLNEVEGIIDRVVPTFQGYRGVYGTQALSAMAFGRLSRCVKAALSR
jgi:hypothetical protein